jgi:hypothetical protein
LGWFSPYPITSSGVTTTPEARMSSETVTMADSKVVENDREVVSQEEGKKEAMAGGHGDLMLGGRLEKKLLLKMDLHLTPLIMLLYTFSFLDRCVTPSKS